MVFSRYVNPIQTRGDVATALSSCLHFFSLFCLFVVYFYKIASAYFNLHSDSSNT